MSRFTIPRDIYYGDNAIEMLSSIANIQRATVVCGGNSMQKHGFLNKTLEILKSAGIKTDTVEGVEPDPSVETVMKGAKQMEKFEPQLIVALGGGSAIDAAKAMWIFYENPKMSFKDILTPFSLPKLRKKAIFAAIPSTSGTASEVTAFSVITDYANKVKYPIADFEITPDIAILDTNLPLTMPQNITAFTGMDALTHAIEAYVATASSMFSAPLALQAIATVTDDITLSYQGDVAAKKRMHLAQCLAGMAFSNALLGICHSLAHKVGAVFNLPHGECNAILLPYVVRYNSVVCKDLYCDIAKIMGESFATQGQGVNKLVEKIRSLNTSLNIPLCFKDAQVPQSLFEQFAEGIAQKAFLDPCTSSNPRKTSAEELYRLLVCAYFGNESNF